MEKLKSFNLSYFIGKNYFDEVGAQNYLVFQPILQYFTLNSNWITEWKPKRLSNKSLKVVSTTNNALSPSVNYYGDKLRVRFTGSVLQQKAVTYSHKKIINLHVVYETTNFHDIDSYLTLANVLFGDVKLTKNADIDKYKYSGYGIRFDGRGFYSHPSGGTWRNVIIFGADMTLSVNIDNNGKDIFVLRKGLAQGLGEQ